MARSKVAISLDESTLDRLDQLVKKQIFPNRSQAIEEAVTEKLARLELLHVVHRPPAEDLLAMAGVFKVWVAWAHRPLPLGGTVCSG